jgi:hypothetical protein
MRIKRLRKIVATCYLETKTFNRNTEQYEYDIAIVRIAPAIYGKQLVAII